MDEIEDATPHINETSANAAEKNDGAGQECLCPNAKGKCWEKAEKGKYLCSACEKVCINEYDGKVRMMCACDCGPCQQEEDEDESSDEGYDGRAEANEDEKQEDDESTPRKEKKSTHEDTPHPKTNRTSGYTQYKKVKIDIEPDGHCAYATLALQQFGSQDQWHRVRAQLEHWLRLNWSEVKCILTA